jgi:hypothetical protein
LLLKSEHLSIFILPLNAAGVEPAADSEAAFDPAVEPVVESVADSVLESFAVSVRESVADFAQES